MKRVIAALLTGLTLLLAPTSALAAGCPDGFHLHAVGDGDHEHGEHRHAGRSIEEVDRNGNGYICVKHVAPGGVHVHVDDLDP